MAPTGANGTRPGPAEDRGDFWTSRAWWNKAGQTTVAVWASTAVGFVGTVVAARGLGADGYGAVVLAIAAATFISTFLDLTLEEGVVHYGYRALAVRDIGGLRVLLRTSFVFDLIVGVAIAAVIIGLAGPIADVASGGKLDPDLIRLAALAQLAFRLAASLADARGILQGGFAQLPVFALVRHGAEGRLRSSVRRRALPRRDVCRRRALRSWRRRCRDWSRCRR
jgi:hypothetical protein